MSFHHLTLGSFRWDKECGIHRKVINCLLAGREEQIIIQLYLGNVTTPASEVVEYGQARLAHQLFKQGHIDHVWSQLRSQLESQGNYIDLESRREKTVVVIDHYDGGCWSLEWIDGNGQTLPFDCGGGTFEVGDWMARNRADASLEEARRFLAQCSHSVSLALTWVLHASGEDEIGSAHDVLTRALKGEKLKFPSSEAELTIDFLEYCERRMNFALVASANRPAFARAFTTAFNRFKQQHTTGAPLARWLMAHDDVDDVFMDDAELERESVIAMSYQEGRLKQCRLPSTPLTAESLIQHMGSGAICNVQKARTLFKIGQEEAAISHLEQAGRYLGSRPYCCPCPCPTLTTV